MTFIVNGPVSPDPENGFQDFYHFMKWLMLCLRSAAVVNKADPEFRYKRSYRELLLTICQTISTYLNTWKQNGTLEYHSDNSWDEESAELDPNPLQDFPYFVKWLTKYLQDVTTVPILNEDDPELWNREWPDILFFICETIENSLGTYTWGTPKSHLDDSSDEESVD